MNPFDGLQHFRGQGDISGIQILFQLRHAGGADDGATNAPALKDKGQ